MVLRHALRGIPDAIEEASQEEGVSPEDLESRISDNLRSTLESYFGSGAILSRPGAVSRPTVTDDSNPLIERMHSYPSEEEGRPLLEVLDHLSPLAVNSLRTRPTMR